MYEMMLGAFKSRSDSSHSEELLAKLVNNKAGAKEDTQILLSQHSEETLKLEEILNSIQNGRKEESFLKLIQLKEDHQKQIQTLEKFHKDEMKKVHKQHDKELVDLKEKIKQLEHKSACPEVCEIDLSSALTGLNTSSANDYMTHRSNRGNTKENRLKDRMTSLEMSGSTSHSKSKMRSNFVPIKNLKNATYRASVPIEDFEKLQKKCEKQKGYIANQKINEKKLKNDNSILSTKVATLNKEINELKHRLNKLLKADKKVKRRLGSQSKTKKIFSTRKQSHQVKSPRIKKVLSDRSLINGKLGIAFGRRETLDINKSGSLLNLGQNFDKRNSDMNHIMTSDEDISSNLVQKDHHKQGESGSRNQFIRGGGSHNCSNLQSSQMHASCSHSELYQNQPQNVQDNYNTVGSQRVQPEMRNSNICHCDSVRQSVEHELMNHVSNAVNSFLSNHEVKPRHVRGKSKSEIGFTNSSDYGQLEFQNEYENEYAIQQRDPVIRNNILKEYNGCKNAHRRDSSNSQTHKQVCKSTFLIFSIQAENFY